jgi:hypothetical protein
MLTKLFASVADAATELWTGRQEIFLSGMVTRISAYPCRDANILGELIVWQLVIT